MGVRDHGSLIPPRVLRSSHSYTYVSIDTAPSLTYAQLDARAEAVAAALRALVASSSSSSGGGGCSNTRVGVGEGEEEMLVAVRLPRSLGLAVALLGVLKAGMAYVSTCLFVF